MPQGTGRHSWGSSEALGHMWGTAGSAACAFSPLSDMSWVPATLVRLVSCFVKRAEKYHRCGSKRWSEGALGLSRELGKPDF